jgi:hypothetical protein
VPVLVICAGAARAAERADVETIVEQVRARQARIEKVHCEWTARELRPARAMPVQDASGKLLRFAAPETETTQDQSFSLVIDGDELSIEVTGTIWCAVEARFEPYEWSAHVADGVSRYYDSMDLGGGSVDRLDEVDMLRDPRYEALVMAYRLFDPAFPMADPDWTSVAGAAEHDGHPCAVLQTKERAPDGNNIVLEWWMAEDMQWVPVRYQLAREGGQLIREATLRYEAHEEVGWRLASWQVDQPAAGGLHITAVDVRTTFNDAVAVRPPAGGQAKVATIVEQVQARQARVEKVHCEWTGRELHPAYSCPVRDESGKWVEGGGPATDTTQDQSVSLVIDGDELRIDVTGTIWSTSKARFVPFQWSGHLADEVWHHHDSVGGSVDWLAEVEMLYLLFYEPVPVAYRLFDPAFSMADPDWTALAGTAEHDGHPCVVLRMKEPASDGDDIVREWWMAEDMQWVPIRYKIGRESGRLIREATLRYEADEEVGWRLASWQVDQPAAGGLYITAVDVKTTFNDAVAVGPLEVEFPAGITVYDGVRGIEYVAGQEPE